MAMADTTYPVIDFRVRVPWDYRPQSEEEMPPEYLEQYEAVLGLATNRTKTLDTLLSDMSTAGIEHAVMHAEYEYGDPADSLNEAVAQLIDKCRDRFIGFGTISMQPLFVRRALAQVTKVAEMGLKGINIQPSFFGMPMDHRLLYPVYAKAEELGLPVALHTGVNYSVVHPIKNDHPLQLDQVACDFPALKLIAAHAGWPWTAELVAVARKHPSVYLEFGGLAPKYVAQSGTGWEVMYRFMNSLLASQVLFGTDWPVFPMNRAIEEWQAAGLKPEVQRSLLGANAASMLGLAGD